MNFKHMVPCYFLRSLIFTAFVDVSPEERLQLDSFDVAELAGQVRNRV